MIKIKSLLLFITICFLTNLAVAAAKPNSSDINNQIQKLEQQVQTLQKQVKQLPADQQKDMEQQIQSLETQINEIKAESTENTYTSHKVNGWADKYFPLAPFVLASPNLTSRSEYDASDLITNWPSINEDLIILQQRQKMSKVLKEKGIKLPDRPLINLSGYVEGAALLNNDYDGLTTGDIDLSAAELDILGKISPWASAYMVINYDNTSPMQGYRAENSNLYIARAFLTIGNLDKAPVYGSIGQMNVPFGTYDSSMITDVYTKTLAKTKQRAIVLGYSDYGLSAATYIMAGDSYIDNNKNVNNGGFNLSYAFKTNNVDAKVGTGYIFNIADSKGIQNTDAASGHFQGFAYDSDGTGDKHENLQHQVPALDFNAAFSYTDHYHLVGEYITATRPFDTTDLSYNSHGAKVSALNTELGFSFTAWDKPSTFAVGYEQTWEALGVNLPEYTAITELSTSLFRDTVEKLEYRHDINYNSHDTSAGGGSVSMNPDGDYRGRNVVTLHIDFYF